jgi:pyruvate dehydrogenase E1 component alpha subunit
VIFVIENNQYAMGTAQALDLPDDIYTRRGLWHQGRTAVDGMDVLKCKAAGRKAVAHCRAGKGPYILEVMTYRYRGHSMSDPAKYRTREEVQKMREKRDAIEHVRELLLTGKHADRGRSEGDRQGDQGHRQRGRRFRPRKPRARPGGTLDRCTLIDA